MIKPSCGADCVCASTWSRICRSLEKPAPAAEQAARFASAEALRWLEWGTTSYQDFMLGLALVLFAIVIVWTARVPRPVGYLMGLSGLASLVLGWVIGAEGFAPIGEVPSYAAPVFLF